MEGEVNTRTLPSSEGEGAFAFATLFSRGLGIAPCVLAGSLIGWVPLFALSESCPKCMVCDGKSAEVGLALLGLALLGTCHPTGGASVAAEDWKIG